MRIIATIVIGLSAGFVHAETRHAGAHVHGLNHAQIVLDRGTLQINYTFPIAQFQGHDEHDEHDEHEGEEDLTRLTAGLKEMESIFEFVRLPDSAECVQKSINHAVVDVVEDGKSSGDAGHKDVVIEALMTCGKPENVTSFDFAPVFEKFDDLEKIEVEGVIENRSLSDLLTQERALTSI
jgi:hypothetical protein